MKSLQIKNIGNVKVYHLTSGKNNPQWMEELRNKKIKSLRYNEDYRSRIEFIQDFDFPQASTKIKISLDGQFLIVTGIYPPSVKVFDLKQLCLHWERRFNGEINDFIILSEDWKKIAFLRNDQHLEFHTQYGCHERIKIPKFGKTLTYNRFNCEIYASSIGSEIYTLNIEKGQFSESFISKINNIYTIDYNHNFDFLAMGGNGGLIEFWDSRTQKAAAHLNLMKVVKNNQFNKKTAASSIKFNHGGITFATGTSSGEIFLFDIRSQYPLKILDHKYGLPIKKIEFHKSAKKIYTSDREIIKIWNQDEFSIFSSINPEPKINDFCIDSNNGISFVAVEDIRVQAHFIPAVGPAPKWCISLESITEELGKKIEKNIYTDYNFITREDLKELGLDMLLGSPFLKVYMHGFFIHNKLYKQINQINSKDIYKNYLKSKIKKEIKKKRSNKVVKFKTVPKSNKNYALNLLKQKIQQKREGKILHDERFQSLFDNSDFEIEEDLNSLHHPISLKKKFEVRKIY